MAYSAPLVTRAADFLLAKSSLRIYNFRIVRAFFALNNTEKYR